MCGITGFVDFSNTLKKDIIIEMIETLSHRGPNYQSVLMIDKLGTSIALGHARLSIIDLSSLSNQPMTINGRSIVFNGEIYNFKEIRENLEKLGYSFKTNGDTEVLLYAYLEWDLKFVDKLIGMFSLAIYDSITNQLHLIRDRLGVKPLYYFQKDDILIFGSELKAFHKNPGFSKIVSKKSINEFIRKGYIKAPNSIFEDTYKLEPGSILTLDVYTNSTKLIKYWNLAEYFGNKKFDFSIEEAKARGKDLLISSCVYRMIADVPVGVFLSGGFDSSCVAAITQSVSAKPIDTYTVSFPDGKDEAPYARAISNHIGSKHHELICNIKDGIDIITHDLVTIYDEPNADISCIPMIMISKLASKNLKVILSGDGGDEVFGGYEGYGKLKNDIELLLKLKKYSFQTFHKLINRVTKDSKSWIFNKISLTNNLISRASSEATLEYITLNSEIPSFIVRDILRKRFHIEENTLIDLHNITHIEDILQYNDISTVLPDMLLSKVDRGSMFSSLEVREPLLDHRLFEFFAQVKGSYRFNKRDHKIILKQIAYDYIPKELLDRPKIGFDLPLYDWLRNDLNPLMDHYLSASVTNKYKFFDFERINALKASFLKNQTRYPNLIWRIILIHMWAERWLDE
jgi:asparagine synthase (glutamine-hydrolysing)